MSAEKVELGRHLFYDASLSGNSSASCASCHRHELAFTDGLPRALGSTGELHPRSSMTLTNVAYNATFTWANPNLENLEDQIHVPLLNENPIELGVAGNEDRVLARLREAARYEELFRAAFPEGADPIAIDNVVRALASFSRILISGSSAYDRLVYLDDREALSASARRGMRLFFSDRVRCSECHQGFNFSGPVRYRGAAAPGVFHNTGLYNLEGRGLYPPDNPGLREISGLPDDMGRFRAPTLRNIALTAPYMHDGRFNTLEQVLAHYNEGIKISSTLSPLILEADNLSKESQDRVSLNLSEEESTAIMAFLHTLTDEEFVTAEQFSNPFETQ